MKIACFDCFSGASGDMILGSLVDAGAPLERIGRRLRALGLPGLRLHAEKVKRGVFEGTLLGISGIHARRRGLLARVMRIRRAGGISPAVLGCGRRIIARLINAEARVHGRGVRHVHLHELEDSDTVVDVFGTLLALELLGIGTVFLSPRALGAGVIRAAHGKMPVPAPGTAEMLKGLRVSFGPLAGELATPTAAAIFSEVGEASPLPVITVERVGYGAGTRDTPGLPSLLRVFTGPAEPSSAPGRVCRLEAEVDDMNPQLVAAWMERVYGVGALEAWTHPVQMKHQRPGLALVALSTREKVHAVARAFLEETTTLGVRVEEVGRITLERREHVLKTKYGSMRVKVAGSGPAFHLVPEYRDARVLAVRTGVPVRLVLEEARRSAPALVLGRRKK